MPFIEVISPSKASGRLKKIYQMIKDPDGQVDNVLQIHSLRPHGLEGHMALYKAVLHHSANQVPVWFLEAIGVLVSRLNQCTYCERHHAEGLKRQIGDDAQASELLRELSVEVPAEPFTLRQQAALAYAAKLTREPGSIGRADLQVMQQAGYSDGEILEINQVTAYFAYANRTVNGLGVEIAGEKIGLSPTDTADVGAWNHQ